MLSCAYIRRMSKVKIFTGVALLGLAISFIAVTPASATKPEAIPTVASIHNPHLDLTRDASRLRTFSGTNLSYHNGPVMISPVTVQPIFWGPSWANSSFVADKATGIGAFYSQYSGSSYAGIQTQYGQSNGLKVTGSTSASPAITDSATQASSTNSAVLAEVLAKVPYSSLSTNAFYPVYTDLARGSATYCAWHSFASVTDGITTKVIKFGFFFNLDGDPGCTAQTSLNPYSTGTQSLVNVSAHELAETLTDPSLNAWFDSQGNENGDKCAWKFNSNGVTLVPGSTTWQLQGEWNNSTSGCSW